MIRVGWSFPFGECLINSLLHLRGMFFHFIDLLSSFFGCRQATGTFGRHMSENDLVYLMVAIQNRKKEGLLFLFVFLVLFPLLALLENGLKRVLFHPLFPLA